MGSEMCIRDSLDIHIRGSGLSSAFASYEVAYMFRSKHSFLNGSKDLGQLMLEDRTDRHEHGEELIS